MNNITAIFLFLLAEISVVGCSTSNLEERSKGSPETPLSATSRPLDNPAGIDAICIVVSDGDDGLRERPIVIVTNRSDVLVPCGRLDAYSTSVGWDREEEAALRAIDYDCGDYIATHRKGYLLWGQSVAIPIDMDKESLTKIKNGKRGLVELSLTTGEKEITDTELSDIIHVKARCVYVGEMTQNMVVTVAEKLRSTTQPKNENGDGKKK